MNKINIRHFIARYLSVFVSIIYSVKFRTYNFNKTSPVIILTPGKVGSSSIYYTLKSALRNPVFHIHFMSEKGINISRIHHLSSDRKSLPLHLIVSELLRKKIKPYNFDLYLISIIREPITRAISSFFQNLEFYKNGIETKNGINIQKSINILNEILEKKEVKYLDNWFKNEIYEPFGIDVYTEQFNTNDGYQIYRKNNVNLLLLKMETMNDVFSNAIKELLGTDKKIDLKNANIGENKDYADNYEQIKKILRLKKEIIDEIVGSPFFQKFYSEYELQVREKWSK